MSHDTLACIGFVLVGLLFTFGMIVANRISK